MNAYVVVERNEVLGVRVSLTGAFRLADLEPTHTWGEWEQLEGPHEYAAAVWRRRSVDAVQRIELHVT